MARSTPPSLPLSGKIPGNEKGPAAKRVLSHARLKQCRADDQALPILNILVLHTGQTPSVAGLPFFIVMGFGFFISRFTRHLRQ
jgi:hypothetical protein